LIQTVESMTLYEVTFYHGEICGMRQVELDKKGGHVGSMEG